MSALTEKHRNVTTKSTQRATLALKILSMVAAFGQEENIDMKVTLNECPPGLFRFDGNDGLPPCIGFKTEYADTEGSTRFVHAYVVESGEAFWGGTSDPVVRGNLLVEPLMTPEPEAFDPLPDDYFLDDD
jgi:hypothetical protein